VDRQTHTHTHTATVVGMSKSLPGADQIAVMLTELRTANGSNFLESAHLRCNLLQRVAGTSRSSYRMESERVAHIRPTTHVDQLLVAVVPAVPPHSISLCRLNAVYHTTRCHLIKGRFRGNDYETIIPFRLSTFKRF